MGLKIGVIAHYQEMEATFKYLSQQLGCELIFKHGVLDYAVHVAQHMEQKLHVDAIIASVVTADVIKKYVNIPVIPIYINNYNLLEAIEEARPLGRRFAVVDLNKDVRYDLPHLQALTHDDIQRYDLNSVDETEALVGKLLRDRIDVVLTPAQCMYRAASRKGMGAVLIRLDSTDIIYAVESAKIMIQMLEKDREKKRWLDAVVDHVSEGIITIDDTGHITMANSIAHTLLGLEPPALVGKTINSALVQIHHPLLRELLTQDEPFSVCKDDDPQNSLVAYREKVYDQQNLLGTVVRFSQVSALQSQELKTRRVLADKGFQAQITFEQIRSVSRAMAELKAKAMKYALTDSTIVILGESGSGKEMFAQSIHNASMRKYGPFVAVNCTTLSETLLESELFGYDAGAFTGAQKGGKAGLFELAHGGTLFLDEIGDMPLSLQVKLLRVLQEKVVRHVGGSKIIPIDVRVIVATNRNLYQDVQQGSFREDLYYRINVLTLKIPPLRARKEDIPILVDGLIDQLSLVPISDKQITPENLQFMQSKNWNGNVRELRNCLERTLAVCGYQYLDNTCLTQVLHEMSEQEQPYEDTTPPDDYLVLPVGTMNEIELAAIQQILARCGGKKREVERILDISSSTLWRRMKEIDLSN